MLISKLVTDITPVKRYKAPKGFMYLVRKIIMTVMTSGTGIFRVVPYWIEQDQLVVGRIPDAEEILAIIPSNTVGRQCIFSYPLGEKTKFLSLGRHDDAGGGVMVIIHYDLVKASKVDLIWEWFRHGR